LTELDEITHSLTLRSSNAYGIAEVFENFTIDITPPLITGSILPEYNTYIINLSNDINWSDTNLDTCTYNTSYNSTISCNDIYTFPYNGNSSINVTVSDLAGNYAYLNNITLINPYIYVFFNDTINDVLLSNFTFGGKLSNNEIWNSTIYNDIFSLGTNNLLFDLLKFPLTSYSFNITNTTKENFTFEATPTYLNITIRHKEDSNIITGEFFTLEFEGTNGFLTNTTTGNKIVQGLLSSGEYRVVITSENYSTESIFFTYDSQENLDLTAYMIKKNNTLNGFVTIEVLNEGGEGVEGALIEARQWDVLQSDYITTAFSSTGTDGKGNLNIVLDDKLYKFRATKDDFTVETVTSTQITTAENGKTITLTINFGTVRESEYFLDYIIANATESVNNLTNVSTINFDWYSTGGDVTGCINIYRIIKGKEQLITQNCTIGSSVEMITSYYFNSTFDNVIKAEFLIDGIYYPIEEFVHLGNENIIIILKDYDLNYFLLTIVFIIGISLGIWRRNIFVIGGTIGFTGLIGIILAPTIITKGIAIFIFFIAILLLWGVSR